jgi:hypothetical protein
MRESRFVRQHPSMEHTNDEYVVCSAIVEHNVASNLKPAQAIPDRLTWPSDEWVHSQEFETVFELRQILIGLPPSPGIFRIFGNRVNIGLGLH